MRLIYTTANLDEVKKLCNLLTSYNLEFTCEEEVDRDWGSDGFGDRLFHVWIHDEDAIEKAIALLSNMHLILTTEEHKEPILPPSSSGTPFPKKKTKPSLVRHFVEHKLRLPLYPDNQQSDIDLRKRPRVTLFLILLCTCILFIDALSQKKDTEQMPPPVRQILLSTTPVKKALHYDYPEAYELLDKIISSYGPDVLLKPQTMPTPAKFLYESFRKEPLWLGVYPIVIHKAQAALTKEKMPPFAPSPKLFEKISQGEVWRTVTPAFLHNNLLHLFFNMVWLLLLGTQIESKVKPFRYLILLALIALFSNTCQYLMSGPNFLGFSGVVCGMATFIRIRQKQAPWEGYQVSKSTFRFIMIFISVLAFLSCLSALLEIFQEITFPIGIANTAHLAGALFGALLGKLRFFAWQPKDI